MTQTQIEPRSVTMYPEQWDIVEHLAEERMGKNVSMALRRIVDEWAAMQPTPRPEPAAHWDIYQPETR